MEITLGWRKATLSLKAFPTTNATAGVITAGETFRIVTAAIRPGFGPTFLEKKEGKSGEKIAER